MATTQIGNQRLFSGNYGEAFLNNVKIAGWQNWTLTYSANIQPEPQAGTGIQILVPGAITVNVTVSGLMLFEQSFAAIGVEPTNSLTDIAKIPPFTAQLSDQLAGVVIKTAVGCMFDSNTITAGANQAYRKTATFMGVDVSGTGGV